MSISITSIIIIIIIIIITIIFIINIIMSIIIIIIANTTKHIYLSVSPNAVKCRMNCMLIIYIKLDVV